MAELVYETAAADYGEVIHNYLACELGGVTYDNVVAHDAVVRHVAVSHDKGVAAHYRTATGIGATVHGHTLAQSGVVADDSEGFLPVEL